MLPRLLGKYSVPRLITTSMLFSSALPRGTPTSDATGGLIPYKNPPALIGYYVVPLSDDGWLDTDDIVAYLNGALVTCSADFVTCW